MLGILKLGDNSISWYEQGSDFCAEVRQVAQRDIEFVSFKWSGKNSFTARNKAAQKLREHLKLQFAIPNSSHVIFAHSHGGTIAFQALANCPEDWGGKLAGLYTMATPFVAFRKEASGLRWRSLVLSMGPIVIASALLAYFAAKDFALNVFYLIFFIYFCVCYLTGTALFGLIQKFIKIKPLPDKLDELLLPDSITLPCHVTAYRSPGDEASLAIAAAQFVDLLLNRILSFLLRPIFFLFQYLERVGLWSGLLLLSALVGLCVFLFHGLCKSDASIDYLFSGFTYEYMIAIVMSVLIPFAITFFLLPGLLLVGFATGREAIWYAGRATVVAESVPAGVSTRLEFIEFDKSYIKKFRLHHSLHESEMLRRKLGQILRHVS